MLNRRGDVPVTVLVFLTVALLIGTLFIFATEGNPVKESIKDVGVLEELYIRESQIDFYLSVVSERAFEKSKTQGISEEIFVNNFILELRSRELPYEELEGVDEENVFVGLEGNRLTLKVPILVTQEIGQGNIKGAQYSFVFEKD